MPTTTKAREIKMLRQKILATPGCSKEKLQMQRRLARLQAEGSNDLLMRAYYAYQAFTAGELYDCPYHFVALLKPNQNYPAPWKARTLSDGAIEVFTATSSRIARLPNETLARRLFDMAKLEYRS